MKKEDIVTLLPELEFTPAKKDSGTLTRSIAVVESINNFYKTLELSLSSNPEPVLIPARMLNECRSILYGDKVVVKAKRKKKS